MGEEGVQGHTPQFWDPDNTGGKLMITMGHTVVIQDLEAPSVEMLRGEECESNRKTGQTFDVESEISSQVLSAHSPKVQLLDFSAEIDIGIIRLQDRFASRENFVDPEG